MFSTSIGGFFGAPHAAAGSDAPASTTIAANGQRPGRSCMMLVPDGPVRPVPTGHTGSVTIARGASGLLGWVAGARRRVAARAARAILPPDRRLQVDPPDVGQSRQPGQDVGH